MTELDFGNCGNCIEAIGVAKLFVQGWEQFAADDAYPADDDRRRIRAHFVEAAQAGWPIPKPGGGYYETASELELTVVEAVILHNAEYSEQLRTRSQRLQHALSICRGMTLGRTVTIDGQMYPTSICSSLPGLKGIRDEFTQPKTSN